MVSVDKLEDWTIWQKANKIAQGLEKAVKEHAFEKEEELKKELTASRTALIYHISEGFQEDELIPSLTQAKKEAQNARSSVYDALERNCLSKEDFDYFYNELAHLSSAIGKIIIDIRFKR